MTFFEIKKQAEKLAQYVRSLPDFKFYDSIGGNYNHIGATVADAILQARNDYEKKVKPRIERILAQHPDARSTSSVRHFLKSIPATEFLNWNEKNHSERFSRSQRFCRVLDL